MLPVSQSHGGVMLVELQKFAILQSVFSVAECHDVSEEPVLCHRMHWYAHGTPGVELSPNTLRILDRTFGPVTLAGNDSRGASS